MVTISLCMIVRDEAEWLARCLGSVAEVCDEVCVVDTGSTDASPRIAEGFGARLERRAWSDDFAAARNASLDLAHGDWILVLDADEQLDPAAHDAAEARRRLLAFAAGDPRRVGRVLVENRLDDGAISVLAITRFFRRDGQQRFAGRIHEQLLCAGEAPNARADTGVSLLHHGYTAHAIAAKGKLARNVALLERALAERPDDGYLWYQSGRTLALAGEHQRALGALERALERSAASDWAIHALELGAECLRALGRSAQALELVRGALPLVPERADTRFLASLLALDTGDVATAESGFRACLQLAPDTTSGAESAPSASSWAAAYNLGMICELTGRSAESRALYMSAIAACPRHAPSLAGLLRLGA